MAVIDKKIFNTAKMFQCDKCGKTKPYSLSNELQRAMRKEESWLHLDNDRVLCPTCFNEIICAWYNQKELVNFTLQGDVNLTKKKKDLAIA